MFKVKKNIIVISVFLIFEINFHAVLLGGGVIAER